VKDDWNQQPVKEMSEYNWEFETGNQTLKIGKGKKQNSNFQVARDSPLWEMLCKSTETTCLRINSIGFSGIAWQ
jgi:hypothetical protein